MCVFSVTDHRRCQNVVKFHEKVAQELLIPHSDVIHDLLLNRSKGTWILFVNEISGLKTGNIKTHLVVPRVPSINLEIR